MPPRKRKPPRTARLEVLISYATVHKGDTFDAELTPYVARLVARGFLREVPGGPCPR